MQTAPVLLLGFNRPELLRGLIENLRSIRPARVYVAIDGPRPAVPADRVATTECREAVDCIDWPCEVITRFRETNLGCAGGVSDAISWFFEQEEAGIILEDDVRVDPSFFPFCAELLARYRDVPRVCAISGCNFVPVGLCGSTFDYRYSWITHVWGWATWRRAWREYRHDMTDWRNRLPWSSLAQASGNSAESILFWNLMFELVAREIIDSWDYRFIFSAFRTASLTITSNTNLVSNVGFGDAATHTRTAPAALPPPQPIHSPFRGPPNIHPDHVADRWVMRHVMGATAGGIGRQGLRFLGRQLMQRRRLPE